MKHIAKKRFGQNFLTDQAIINSLVEAIHPQADDLMVEIGPGLAAMTQPLLERVQRGDFQPERLVTHRLPLDDAPQAYRMFRDKQDGCVKVVLKPWLH